MKRIIHQGVLAQTLGLLLSFSACSDGERSRGDGELDGGVGALPVQPSQVTVVSGAGFIRLSWTDQSTNELSFVIGRVTLASADDVVSSDMLVELATVTRDQVVYRDEALEPGKFYAYGVAAQNGAGRSAFVVQDGPPAAVISAQPAEVCQVALPSAEDPDGDGLSNEIEAAGWIVRIDEGSAGQVSEREVTSSPSSADSDGDGLCDAFERIVRSDPSRADSDGDGLSDADEVMIWGSSPIHVDSDGDAAGNPAFFDGSELDRYGTSPTLADTDGDGRSDFQEINQNSTHALLADLPQPELRLVGGVDLGVNVRLANGTTQDNAVSTTLSQDTESTVGKTHSVSTSTSSETSAEVTASTEVSFPAGASVSVSASYTQTNSYMREAAMGVSKASVESAQHAYESATSKEIDEQSTLESGRIAVQLQIANAGKRTFELSNLVVTALARDRANPRTFSSVATLSLPPAADTITLGDGEARGPFRAEATVPASVVLDLLANPGALYFRPASFQLKDQTGENFEFSVGETTNNRTALLVIDYGGERPLESYRVATNVARVDGGKLAGVKLGAVLEHIIGLSPDSDAGYRTTTNAEGVRVLTQVRDCAARQGGQGSSKFWVVMAAPNESAMEPVSKRLLDASVHFEDRVLMPRDQVYLTFDADEDGDGVFAREERARHTSDTNPDSDGDGLSDLEEMRDGWLVHSPLPYYANNPRVFGNPTLADADGDGLDDAAEKQKGTDPNRADTDGDGLDDSVDAEPLEGLLPAYARSFGTVANELPLDIAVDRAQNVYLLGSGGGDFDGDGYVASNGFYRSAFIGSWDALGQRRWLHEFEDALPQALSGDPRQTRLNLGEDGHLFWIETLRAGALPGVTKEGPHIVEFGADGSVVAARRLSYPSSPGHVDSFLPTWAQRLPDGRWALVGANSANGFTRVMITDGDGLVSAVRDVASSGLSGFVRANGMALISGCELLHYDFELEEQGSSDFCATYTYLGRGFEHPNGTLYLTDVYGSLSAFSEAGTLLWTQVAVADANGMSALHVDALGRAYVGNSRDKPGALASTIRGVTPGGSLSFSASPPEDFASVALTVDPIGNVYTAGYSGNGMGGFVQAHGGLDLVVMRNPQLLFE